ncbi:cellulose synthase-like protein G2 isoform X2 [Macadamia integrifolia]|uniref:cellulose synthase-like protein G2 isoform X2 n=1 Tax=Macadamia integrifolia TaxID=60698 RepID=UPI001C4F9BBC|nr:cellulose synthase-like protein G2 isoform X2 [Macadamia integrifolia]
MKNYLPLHECKVQQPHATIYKLHNLFHAIFLLALLYYRTSSIFLFGVQPTLPWALIFTSELLLCFIWLLRQPLRWHPVYRTVFPERLPGDDELPAVDVFICTADPNKEPTVDVMNTVVSAMSLDYPPEKLSVYLSDDAGSLLTLYALHEAASFASSWVPFCRKYKIGTICPDAFLSGSSSASASDTYLGSMDFNSELEKMKSKYELFKERVQRAKEKCETGLQQDRPPLIEVIGDNQVIPLLVYVSREKRSSHPHHFKAGALNLRVSGIISNAPYILVLDCDMNCNNPSSVRQAMCFHLDPKLSPTLAFVQFPQAFYNVGNNDIYDGRLRSPFKTQWPCLDGLQGPFLSGSGFYIKRQALYKNPMHEGDDLLQLRSYFGNSNRFIASLHQNYQHNPINGGTTSSSKELLQEAQLLASCSYEKDTQWGEQRGFLYHSIVEDYFSGFIMHSRGWKSVYYEPSSPAFLGSATITFNESMIQNLRWNSGLLEVGLSSFCPIIYGISRMSIPQAMGYGFWAFQPLYSFPLLCYATIPQLCLLNGISLYPKVSNPWFIVFAIIYISSLSQHLLEVLLCGDSLRTWWNEQRNWMIKSVASYSFSCWDVFMKKIGIREANFMLTSKVIVEEQVEQYKKGIFHFKGSKWFLVTLATLVTINMVSLGGGLARVMSEASYDDMFGQVFLSFAILTFNYPIIEGMIFRKDNGRISTSISIISVTVSIIFLYLGSFLFF